MTSAYLAQKKARGHMVMVLGWAHRWNWVKAVTVSIPVTAGSCPAAQTSDSDSYHEQQTNVVG